MIILFETKMFSIRNHYFSNKIRKNNYAVEPLVMFYCIDNKCFVAFLWFETVILPFPEKPLHRTGKKKETSTKFLVVTWDFLGLWILFYRLVILMVCFNLEKVLKRNEIIYIQQWVNIDFRLWIFITYSIWKFAYILCNLIYEDYQNLTHLLILGFLLCYSCPL